MKKFLLFIVLIAFTGSLFAQITVLFEEDFEGLTAIPEDWVLVNVDSAIPDDPDLASMEDSAFIVVTSTFFEGKIAMGVSYYSPLTSADDWMILPAVTLGDESKLMWDAMSLTSSGSYPDDYEIYVSTTTQDITGCEANGIQLFIDNEDWRVDAGGNGIQSRELDLSAFAGETVYVAFRLMTPDPPGGDRLAIDNIQIVDGTSSVSEIGNSTLNLYPNPVTNYLTITSEFDIEMAVIYDLTGKAVLKAYNNFNSINVSDLNSGIYLVNIMTKEGLLTKKISIVR